MYIINRAPKPIVWIGTAFEDLRGFPEEAKRRAGYQLRRVQIGLMPSDWKPLGIVGAGEVPRLRAEREGEP